MAGTSQPFFWASRNAWYINQVGKNGKRTKRKLADTKSEAFRIWKLSLKAATRDASNPLFLTISGEWISEQVKRTDRDEVSENWLQRVTRTIEKFNLANQGVGCLDVTPSLLGEWIKGKSANYERTEFATIKQCLNWAVSTKRIGAHSLTGLKLASMQRRERILSLEEHNKLCRHSSRPFKQLLRFAWMTGSRPGELRLLRWEQISNDLSRAVLREHKTHRKSRKPRSIYFPPLAQKLLRKYKKTCETGFVFLNSRGKPWTSNAVVQRMQQLREDTGIEAVAYNYRHTWITRAMIADVDAATIAELSGHSSIAMIERVYGHLGQHAPHLAKAAAKIK
jgi:integrase